MGRKAGPLGRPMPGKEDPAFVQGFDVEILAADACCTGQWNIVCTICFECHCSSLRVGMV